LNKQIRKTIIVDLVHPIDSWTKNDVQKWIEYCIDEYSLGDVNLTDFEMNGERCFCSIYNYEVLNYLILFLSIKVKHYYY
jgi:hypothetical protein